MDPLSLSLAVVAVVAIGALLAIGVSLARLSRSVDDALQRIGDRPADRWMQRPAALRRAVHRLERASAGSEQSRRRLEGALGETPIGVIAIDPAGVVEFANPAAARYLGARHGEAVAEVRIGEAIAQVIASGTPATVEVSLYTPVPRSLLVTAVPLAAAGEPIGAAAYVQDVTESRRVDEIRRDFIANVGHELKTPLGALALLAETLGSRVGEPEVAARLAARVGEESTRLSRLVDDMLDLSRAETSPARFEPVRLAAVVDDVAANAEQRAAEFEVRFEVERLDRDAVVMGDRRQLRSMLTNLVDNAVKYSHPAGNGDRPWPRVRVRAFAEGDQVVVEVEDEGIGIPESHQARIFERFYRVDRARSRATGGTGLGLSIVRNVVVNHGGTVTVESKVGEGSVFRVTLPLFKEEG